MSEVKVRVTADNQTRTGFQQALGDARRFGQEARRSVGGGFATIGSELRSSLAGALAGVGIGNFIRSTFDQLGRINDLSQQFGVSAETLQRLGQVASESGVNIEQVASALNRLKINIQEAQSGTGKQADALRQLGLSAASLQNLSATDQLLALADALQRGGLTNENYAATLDLITARNARLIPLLAQGGDAIRQQASQITVASDEIVAKADQIGDSFSRLGQQITANLGGPLVEFGKAALSIFATLQAAVDGIVGTIVQSAFGLGAILKGDFAFGASQIQSAPLENALRVAAELEAKIKDIYAPPRQKTAAGIIQEDFERAAAETSGRQELGTRTGNVIGKQLSPGSFEGAAEFEKERNNAIQEARRAAIDSVPIALEISGLESVQELQNALARIEPKQVDVILNALGVESVQQAQEAINSLDERTRAKINEARAKEVAATKEQVTNFKQNTDLLEARASGDKQREEDILQQQDFENAFDVTKSFEDASRFAAASAALRAQQETDVFQGQFGASSLQRIGGASTEFFRTRGDDPKDLQRKANDLLKRMADALDKGEPLVLGVSR